ncbi:organic cation transporter protein-like [Haliotis rufescens]|uniref:organic cation transporter protein-like n=1 Tax=Haliotis rufescens TaxID=6454 RepID=UPI00201E80D9|nr:organic cation transporter protein-like [Haliotis rufescens]
MSEYEAVLTGLRPFGPYQIRVFILVSAFETPLAWAMLLPIFTSAKPPWTCGSVSMDTGYSVNSTSLRASNSSNVSAVEAAACLPSGQLCPGMRFSDEFTSILSEWGLVCSRSYIPNLITSIQMVGVLVGAVATGQLADLLGRKKMLFVEYTLLLVVWFGSAFANSWELYAAFRFIVGALVGGTLVVNFVLPLEFVTPAWRTFCGCIGFWAVGLMTLALWAFFMRDWRHLTMATSASGVFLLFTWWFIPESPRWLLSQGRFKDAERILTAMAATNKRPLPDLSPLQLFVEREHRKVAEQKKYSYFHLCSSWKLTRGSLFLMYGWFVSSSVYYGLNFNSKNLSGDRYLNVFLSGLVEIPALIFVALVNNSLGRRKTTTLLIMMAGVFCFSILILDVADVKLTSLTLVFALLGKAGISGGWAAVQVFSAETFPTVVRNIGIGACSMAARIGGIVAPQIVFLGDIHKPVPFAVFGVLSLVCGVLMMFMSETAGAPLPDQLHVSTTLSINRTVLAQDADQNRTLTEHQPLAEVNMENCFSAGREV